MKSYSDIRRALAGKLWFIHEAKLNEMLALLEVKLASGVMPEVRASSSQAAIRTAKTTGAIACIPIYGLITHRASMWSYLLWRRLDAESFSRPFARQSPIHT